jgi:hypothetical protein
LAARRDRLVDAFWARHSNPKSGWSRTLVNPVLIYALYRRNWRLLAAALVFTAINPVLFPPPETDEAWMTRAVHAERWWLEQGRGTMGRSYPNVCNTLAVPGFLYALYAAWRRRPAGMALATALSMVLKLWWVGVLVRRFDEHGEKTY